MLVSILSLKSSLMMFICSPVSVSMVPPLPIERVAFSIMAYPRLSTQAQCVLSLEPLLVRVFGLLKELEWRRKESDWPEAPL